LRHSGTLQNQKPLGQSTVRTITTGETFAAAMYGEASNLARPMHPPGVGAGARSQPSSNGFRAPNDPPIPLSLIDEIVEDANRVASPGGAISDVQATALRQNLPVIQRRSAAQNAVLRDEFRIGQARYIGDWERMTGNTWPEGATPHHIIPLESGGANAWWNLMPTNGSLPNHSLPGIPGPHAAGGLLRGTIQRGRRALPPGTTTDLRKPR
jgi:hypothetical protein